MNRFVVFSVTMLLAACTREPSICFYSIHTPNWEEIGGPAYDASALEAISYRVQNESDGIIRAYYRLNESFYVKASCNQFIDLLSGIDRGLIIVEISEDYYMNPVE